MLAAAAAPTCPPQKRASHNLRHRCLPPAHRLPTTPRPILSSLAGRLTCRAGPEQQQSQQQKEEATSSSSEATNAANAQSSSPDAQGSVRGALRAAEQQRSGGGRRRQADSSEISLRSAVHGGSDFSLPAGALSQLWPPVAMPAPHHASAHCAHTVTSPCLTPTCPPVQPTGSAAS